MGWGKISQFCQFVELLPGQAVPGVVGVVLEAGVDHAVVGGDELVLVAAVQIHAVPRAQHSLTVAPPDLLI